MTEWERVNDEAEDHAALKQSARYRLGEGEAHAYGPGVIHSTEHAEKAWVIRITGTNLANVPRYRFDPKTDLILENS